VSVSRRSGDFPPVHPIERFFQDPAAPGVLLMAGLVVGGFVTLAFAWRSVARTIYVALQVPGIVSGGLGGVALIGLGAVLLAVQLGRRDAAQERRVTDELLDEVAALVALGPAIRARAARRRKGHGRGRRPGEARG
jgi:hypothetical protein